LVEQQMFTLAINALPTDIPAAIEADISALTIGGQVRVSDLTLPTGVTTDVEPETAVAIGQPPRVIVEEEPAEGEAAEGEGAEGEAAASAEASGGASEAQSEEG
jgi:large subunit ribosomal protein L25